MELLAATLPWLPFTLAPVLLLLVAPGVGPGGRRAIAGVLALGAVAAAICAGLAPSELRELKIVNPFLDPDLGKPRIFVVDIVNAAAWRYPLVGAVCLAIPAALLWWRRNRPAHTPCPVVFPFLLTCLTVGARLALEKNAAPEPLTFAIGASMPLVLMLPFVGWWCGRKGFTFGKLVLILLLVGLTQRALIVGLGYLATVYGLGTHLDVSAITKVHLPLGEFDYTGPGDHTFDQWLRLMLIPQFLLWVPGTIGLGIGLGFLPYRMAKSRSGD